MPASISASRRSAALVLLLDEIEKDDDVTHDHADQAGNAQDHHETQRHVHQPYTRQRAHRAEGNPGKQISGLMAFLN